MKDLQALSSQPVCPACGSPTVSTEIRHDRFKYGSGGAAKDIDVELPFRVCRACGFEFTDDASEKIRHDAVCEHLGVLPPSEIGRIRDTYGLSRPEFARISKLGEATLARWERGALIQNAANDVYLRLLSDPQLFERVKRWSDEKEKPIPAVAEVASAERQRRFPKFRGLKDVEQKRSEQQQFELRKAG